MERLALIDISLEDDSLLPSTSSPEISQPFQFLFPASPTEESDVKDSPRGGSQQTILCDTMGISSESKLFVTPKSLCKDDIVPTNSVLTVLDVNARDDPKLANVPAHSNVRSNAKSIKGKKESSSLKPSGKALTHARTVSWSDSVTKGSWRDTKPRDNPKLPSVSKPGLHSHQPESLSTEEDPTEKSTFAIRPELQRSARALSSLRKSLAWDKAFSTDEGVLDLDDLPFLGTVVKNSPQLPPVKVPEILSRVSPAPPTLKAVDVWKRFEELSSTAGALCDSPGFGKEASRAERDAAGHCGSPTFQAVSETKAELGSFLEMTIPRSVPINEVIETAIQKGTRLRIPSSFSGQKAKEKSAEEPPMPVGKPQKEVLPRCSSTSALVKQPPTLSKRVSSVSKKVKDTLGRVLPGSLGRGLKNSPVAAGNNSTAMSGLQPTSAGGARPLSSLSGRITTNPGPPTKFTRSRSARAVLTEIPGDSSANANALGDTSNKAVANACGNSVSGLKGKAPPKPKGESIWGSFRSKTMSKGDSQTIDKTVKDTLGQAINGSTVGKTLQSPRKTTHQVVDMAVNSKPSGLRLPSPKIGFFDSGRPSPSQSSALAEGGQARCGLPPRPQSSGRVLCPSGEGSAPAPISAIPSAPHLRPGKQVLGPSLSAPTSPYRSTSSNLLSPGAHRALTDRFRYRKNNTDRGYSPMDCAGPVTQEECKNAATRSLRLVTVANEEKVGRQVEVLDVVENPEPSLLRSSDTSDKLESEVAPSPCIVGNSVSDRVHESPQCSSNTSAVGWQDMHATVASLTRGNGPSESFFHSESEREVPMLSELSSIEKPKKLSPQIKIQDILDSPSHWSQWHVLKGFSSCAIEQDSDIPSRSPVKQDNMIKSCISEIIQEDIAVRSMSPLFEADGASGKNPLAVNRGLLNLTDRRSSTTPPLKTEKTSLFALAKSAVSRFTSSKSPESGSDQENSLGGDGKPGSSGLHNPKGSKSASKNNKLDQSRVSDVILELPTNCAPFSEERICALEAAGEEVIQMKTGAVQHSPPNKSGHKSNPWSPVRRNGQQLGPFDCTKKKYTMGRH